MPAEVATVTGRTRRIFKFSRADFRMSLQLARPDIVAFTHLDYINVKPTAIGAFERWQRSHAGPDTSTVNLMLSDQVGHFHDYGQRTIYH